MMAIKLIQDRGIEALGRFYSRYRGVVINNEDPDGLQRLEIIIPNIHNGIKIWARPSNQQGGINYGIKYFTPLVGEVVWVEFEKGNLSKAIWSYHGWSKDEVPEELKSNSVAGIITPQNNRVILDDDNGGLTIILEKSIHLVIPDKCSIDLTEDTLELSRGDTKVSLSDNGVSIKKGSNSLKSTLNRLIQAISSMTVICSGSGSPSSVPSNVSEFINIQNELNSYIED